MRILPIGEPMALSLNPFAIEQCLEVGDLLIVQGKHVGFVDRAKLDVPHAATLQNVNLFLRFGKEISSAKALMVNIGFVRAQSSISSGNTSAQSRMRRFPKPQERQVPARRMQVIVLRA
jgi:hypothetical protein